MGIRDIKRKARGDLHREMSIPALYLATKTSQPVPVTIRLLIKFAALGIAKNGAEMLEEVPKAVLLASEQMPSKNAILSVDPGEAYRIALVHPADDQFITVDIVKLSAAEASGLPTPSA